MQYLMSRRLLKPINQNPITHARRIAGLAYLKRQESSIGGNHRVGGLATFVVVEVCQTGEVFSGSIELELPDINVTVTTFASQPRALAVGLDSCVESVGKNAFRFVVRARSL